MTEGSTSWWRTADAARAGRAALDVGVVLAGIVVGVGGHLAAVDDPSVEAASASPAAVMCAVVAALVLLARRRRPIAALGALVAVVIVAAGVLGDPGLFSAQIALELVVLFHAIGSWTRRAPVALVVTAGATALGFVASVGTSGVAAAAAFSAAVVALPCAVGFAARSRRETLAAVRARLEQAERERDERARRAVLEDRARLAAELHDVVAHHVSLIGVQAGAARVHLRRDPAAAESALAAVEGASRAAVGEMRRILDVLDPREGDPTTAASRAPVPTIAQLDALASDWRGAGLTVDVAVDPALLGPDAVSVDRSACIYRIVEEGITNVARHSTAGRVTVVVGRDAATVVVRVADPGPARRPDVVGGGAGRGLDGARRRVDLFGGTLVVGPDGAGGFCLEARIPEEGP